MTLELMSIPGEAAGEQNWTGARDGYTCWLTQEYAGAPWAWTITVGKDAIAFGDAADRATAVAELEIALDRVAPPPQPPTSPGGLVGLMERLLWGTG